MHWFKISDSRKQTNIFCPHDFFDGEEKYFDFLCESLLFCLAQRLFIGEKKICERNRNVEFLSSYKQKFRKHKIHSLHRQVISCSPVSARLPLATYVCIVNGAAAMYACISHKRLRASSRIYKLEHYIAPRVVLITWKLMIIKKQKKITIK